MRVYGFKNNENGIMNIENTLEAQQEFVGGHLEGHFIASDLMLICNEDGKMLNLSPRAAWITNGKFIDFIMGDFFVCRIEKSEGVDILDEDIKIIKERLIPVKK